MMAIVMALAMTMAVVGDVEWHGGGDVGDGYGHAHAHSHAHAGGHGHGHGP